MEKKHSVYMIDFLIFFCIILSLFSPLMVHSYSAVLCTASFFLWMLFTLQNRKKWRINEIINVFFYGYTVIVPYIAGYGVVGNRYLILGIVILGCSISNYCEYANRWESIGVMLKMAVPFFAYVYIKTFLGLRENPWNARLITDYGAHATSLRLRGIGGYEFIYFLAILVSICTGLFFLLKNRKQKVFFLLVGILAYIEIVLSNYMTALLIATVGIALTIMMFLIKRNRAWLVIFTFGLVFVVFFGNIVIGVMLDIFIKYIPKNGRTYERLYILKDSFFQNLALLFFKERNWTIQKSVNCFLKYPLLGIVGRVGLSRKELLSNVGQHSYFFDTFAFYGSIIGALSVLNYFSVFRKKFFEGNLCVITVPVMTSGFLLLLFNNVTLSIGVATGIVYPYTLYILRKKEENAGKF